MFRLLFNKSFNRFDLGVIRLAPSMYAHWGFWPMLGWLGGAMFVSGAGERVLSTKETP